MDFKRKTTFPEIFLSQNVSDDDFFDIWITKWDCLIQMNPDIGENQFIAPYSISTSGT